MRALAAGGTGGIMGEPSRIDTVELARGVVQDGFMIDAADGTCLAVRTIRIPPGGTTGVHRHDGEVVAVVESGVLTHHAPVHPTGTRRYRGGEAFVEGADYLHEAVNEGVDDVVLWLVYVEPQRT